MKKIVQILFGMLCALQIFAQSFTAPPYADIDVNHRTYVNNVFGLLKQNRLSTGLLIDYGLG